MDAALPSQKESGNEPENANDNSDAIPHSSTNTRPKINREKQEIPSSVANAARQLIKARLEK